MNKKFDEVKNMKIYSFSIEMQVVNALILSISLTFE